MMVILRSEVKCIKVGEIRYALAPYTHIKIEGVFGWPSYDGTVRGIPDDIADFVILSIAIQEGALDLLVGEELQRGGSE